MMGSHRDLVAWQAARASFIAIQRFTDANWRPQRSSPLDQVRRAAISVMLNISEGYAHGPGKRCRWHLRVAHASSVETTDVLEVLQELGDEVTGEIELSRRVQSLTYRLWLRSRG
ncbi:MAG TPA: four helix bundle protein [Gemmatimonadales bacterium]|nr:four helix bundle protein [Gemmatimonadales bacterium]